MIHYILFIFDVVVGEIDAGVVDDIVSVDEIEVASVVDVVVIEQLTWEYRKYDELILPPHVTKCGT